MVQIYVLHLSLCHRFIMAPFWINTNSNTGKFQSSITVFLVGAWEEGAGWKWWSLRGKIKIQPPEDLVCSDSSSESTSDCWQQSKSSTLRAQRVTYHLKIKTGQCRLQYLINIKPLWFMIQSYFFIIVMLLKVLCSPINCLKLLA